MIKKLKIFLISILLLNFSTINNRNWDQYSSGSTKPFYKNIDQNFSNYGADVTKANAGSNNTYTSGTGTILQWNQYANSWEEFKANYQALNLTINMNIAFNWYNIKWSSSSLNIPLSNITIGQTKWIQIKQIDETTTQGGRWDSTHGKLSYACWVNTNNILIRFKLQSWASNNYDNYYYSIDTRSVKCNSSFNYNRIKSLLDDKVNNKTLILDSDHSTSLQDYRNIPIEQIAITNLLKAALDKYYEAWKPYIGAYAYSDNTNQATITIKFNDPNNNHEIMWTFKITIKFNLTQNYWNKSFKDRLTIIPGKIIDINNPNGKMITDEPLKWESKDVYGTTAFIRFDAANDGSETMKVNGTPIEVINNQFTFQMTDNQEHQTNEYHILLEKHDLKNFSTILGKYEINYLIKQDIPQLDLKWYAWNPGKNPNQKSLITPILENGESNPNYDVEVNAKTGTKTQIMWIKHQSLKPFALDPLNKDGDIINDNNYDQGFLAEGAVSGMGITQNFNDLWIKSVIRIKVNDQTLQPIDKPVEIKSDNQGSYFSLEGTYLYTITDQKGIAASKFVIIGQKWQDKYAKFLDVLNNSSVAINFWSTTQGFHLKNYLAKYKYFNTKDIQNLSFEQVFSYWKEYVSNVKSQHIGPDISPTDNIDLTTINLDAIKINSSDINIIRNNVINGITKQLSKYQLEFNIDYQINNLEFNLNQLLQFDQNNNAIINLTINALDTSIKVRNSTTITIRNSKDYIANKVIDLSAIKFDTYQYNFSKFKIEQLKQWILKAIANKLQLLAIKLSYQTDYEVVSLENDALNDFIVSKEPIKLQLIIKSQLLSNRAVNSTSLTIINNLDSEIAPPDPPNPKIDPDILIVKPDPNNDWFDKQQNLIILTITVSAVITSILVIIFVKYRFKKGIGGKKNKTKNKQKN